MDNSDATISWIAEQLKLGHLHEIEKNLQDSGDKSGYWKLIENAVAIVHGDDHVFTQHGIQRRVSKRYSDAQQYLFIAKILETMDRLSQAMDVEYFLTSGTLLGLTREGALIAHDDDIDLAYISKATDRFNWALERRTILKYLRSLPGCSAIDHMPGLIHVGITLDDGVKARFDLFSAIVEQGKVIEYPLDTELLAVEDVLPLHKVEFLGCEVPIPAVPERFLTVNYGEGWRVPDPTFRFDWIKSKKQYADLLTAMLKETPPIGWLGPQIKKVCGFESPAEVKDFDVYKIAALKYALELKGPEESKRLMILGATSAGLINFCIKEASESELEFVVVDPLEPLDVSVGPFEAGRVMAHPEIIEKAKSDSRLYLGKYEELEGTDIAVLKGKADIVYLDAATAQSALGALQFAEKYLADDHIIICDDFLYVHEKRYFDGQYSALTEWYQSSRTTHLKCVGRTEWAQAIFSGNLVLQN